jgi:hypothetical protein
VKHLREKNGRLSSADNQTNRDVVRRVDRQPSGVYLLRATSIRGRPRNIRLATAVLLLLRRIVGVTIDGTHRRLVILADVDKNKNAMSARTLAHSTTREWLAYDEQRRYRPDSAGDVYYERQ